MTCEEALEKAIQYLKQYADDDDNAGLNGSGCYSNPDKVVEAWINEIKILKLLESKGLVKG